jgi:hypothetical protein
MKKSVEKEFDEIAEEAQSRCDSVECSKEHYLEGLELVISMLDPAKKQLLGENRNFSWARTQSPNRSAQVG